MYTGSKGPQNNMIPTAWGRLLCLVPEHTEIAVST